MAGTADTLLYLILPASLFSTPTASPSFGNWHPGRSCSRTVRRSSQSNLKGWPMMTADVRTPTPTPRPIDAAMHGGGDSTDAEVIDDHALLASLRAGHEWAFETMVRLYGGRLLAVARRFTRNNEDAQDVLQ